MSENKEEIPQEEEEPRSEVIDSLPDVEERKAGLEKGLAHHDAEELESLRNRGIIQEKSGAKLELEKNLKSNQLGRAIDRRSDADDLRARGILRDEDAEELAKQREETATHLADALSHRPTPEQVEEKVGESTDA